MQTEGDHENDTSAEFASRIDSSGVFRFMGSDTPASATATDLDKAYEDAKRVSFGTCTSEYIDT